MLNSAPSSSHSDMAAAATGRMFVWRLVSLSLGLPKDYFHYVPNCDDDSLLALTFSSVYQSTKLSFCAHSQRVVDRSNEKKKMKNKSHKWNAIDDIATCSQCLELK